MRENEQDEQLILFILVYWSLAKNPFSHIQQGQRPTKAIFWKENSLSQA